MREYGARPTLERFSLWDLGIMLAWGNLQEIVVDLVGNGWNREICPRRYDLGYTQRRRVLTQIKKKIGMGRRGGEARVCGGNF